MSTKTNTLLGIAFLLSACHPALEGDSQPNTTYSTTTNHVSLETIDDVRQSIAHQSTLFPDTNTVLCNVMADANGAFVIPAPRPAVTSYQEPTA